MKRIVSEHKKRVLILGLLFAILWIVNTSAYAEWKVVPLPYVSSCWYLQAVHFTSSNEGWAVGDDCLNGNGVLLHYLNGSWTSVTSPILSSFFPSSVHFTSSNEGWAVGDGANHTGALLHYLNGSWELLSPPNVGPPGYIYWSLNDVHFTSSKEGWAVGDVFIGNNPIALLLHYINGFWVQDDSINFSQSSSLLGIHFTSPNEGWAVGTDNMVLRGILLHYSNGSWAAIDPPYVSSNWDLNAVHFTSPNEGWAVGLDLTNSQGALLHYLNGSWTPIHPPFVNTDNYWWLNSVHFTSANEGWASGRNISGDLGVLIHYSDGSWTTSELPPFPPLPSSSRGWVLSRVYFPSSDQGWAVGGLDYSRNDFEFLFSGVVLKYSSPETVSPPTNLRGPTSGIIGKSYKYTTGGSTSNLSHMVEYQFDWKEGGLYLSDWGPGSLSKEWNAAGVYNIRARARCTQDISVVSDWSNSLSVSISIPNISATPTAYDFRNIKVNRSKTASFRVKNNGTADLSISTSITGTDQLMFMIMSGGGSNTIKPGKTLTIKVNFKPTSKGSKASTLRIASNDPDTPTIDIQLNGTGQ